MRAALEVLRDGGLVDVLHHQAGQLGRVQLEAARVGHEVEHSAGSEPRGGVLDQRGVVACHVEVTRHALAARVAGRVQQDAVEAAARPAQPPQAVGALEEVPARGDAVQLEVAHAPVEVVGVEVHAHHLARHAGGGVHAGGAGVGEEVQHEEATALVAQRVAQRAHVHEQPAVQVLPEVHLEAQALLLHHLDDLTRGRAPLVLPGAPRRARSARLR
jgi:hypothetical protein